jgi:hypothetical protein
MDQTAPSPSGESAWLGDKAPCVYCGQVVPRSEDRCPHCRASFSLAVRKASREVLGPWYYLDPRNPSGRGVTFETLIKMIEKGRIRADSIVRGPTTHQDWMYAAEAPRLAKYMGMCPHCFAEAKPEDTYCTRCQLNMNTRPAEPRPGVPPDLVKEPVQKAAYEMEKQLSQEAAPSSETLAGEALDVPATAPPPSPAAAAPPAGASLVAKPPPRAEPAQTATAVAAAAAMAEVTPGGERPSHVSPLIRRRKPKLWVILALTWGTLIPLVLIWFLLVPDEWKKGLFDKMGSGAGGGSTTTVTPPPKPTDEWLNEQLRLEGKAEEARDWARAIEIYEAILAKTGDATYRARISDLRQKLASERSERLAKLRERLQLADGLAKEHRYDDAKAVLRNIGPEDRDFLASLKGPDGRPAGISVEKMEAAIRDEQTRWTQQKQVEDGLTAQLARAAQLRSTKKLAEALDEYKSIQSTFPAELVQKYVDVGAIIKEIQTLLAAAKPVTPPTPEKTPDEVKAAIDALLAQAEALAKSEKFTEALAKFEEVRQKYEQKHWPPDLEKRIEQTKARKEALEFFGIEGKNPKKAKTP